MSSEKIKSLEKELLKGISFRYLSHFRSMLSFHEPILD